MFSKKKTLILISILGGLLLLVGVFWLGKSSVENKPSEPKNNLPSNSQEKEVLAKQIQKLEAELNSVKNELKQSNTNQKSQLENRLFSIENKIKILTNQDKSTVQELEKEIKEIKGKIKNDKPGDNPKPVPGDRKEEKFVYVCFFKDYHIFRNIVEGVNPQDWRIIYVSENHPKVKRLLGKGKLQEKKWFNICYGKADEEERNLWLTFNENNRELEITEV